MKDTTITAKQKRTELLFLGVSLLLAILINVFSIIIYHTRWIELISTWYITIILTFLIYLILLLFRLLFTAIRKISR